jgi:zinc protease
VGALPSRSSTKPSLNDERKIDSPARPAEKEFTFQSKIENGSAIVSWAIPPLGEEIGQMRRLQILASVLDDRLRTKLREELGATYSPQAHAMASAVFEYGALTAASNVKPGDAEKVSKLILEMGAELAEKGASADELDRALKPALSNLEKSLRENSYWASLVLAQSQEQPYRLDWARSRDNDYKSVTLEEINALAKEFLEPKNGARVTIKSTAPAESEGAE